MGLNAQQRDDFERDGVLVIEGFADQAACRALIHRSHELLEAFEPESISVFTTHEQTRTSDDYFLDSGDKVRFFFEEDAFAADGSLKQAKEHVVEVEHQVAAPVAGVGIADLQV